MKHYFAILQSFLIVGLVASISSANSTPWDHCFSCQKLTLAEPGPAERCPNLDEFGSDFASVAFLKKVEGRIAKKYSMWNFQRLGAEVQVPFFLSAFMKVTETFTADLSTAAGPGAESARARLARDRGKERLETPALEEGSEGLSVEEIVDSEVLPSPSTRARLFFALAKRFGVSIRPLVAWSPKADGTCDPAKPQIMAVAAKEQKFLLYSIDSADSHPALTVDRLPAEGEEFQIGEAKYRVAKILESSGRGPAQEASKSLFCQRIRSQVEKVFCGGSR